ncbi:hypothetical protein [Erythrobacter sp. HL-111]|uniref:hypothetical protein n=1 Tax=Erythrobacter sp. HL-111 TaxID=1798193 RepID=UPI0018D4AD5D|nr:hypothetical protein [Erythrobacter sp. HL-111]
MPFEYVARHHERQLARGLDIKIAKSPMKACRRPVATPMPDFAARIFKGWKPRLDAAHEGELIEGVEHPRLAACGDILDLAHLGLFRKLGGGEIGCERFKVFESMAGRAKTRVEPPVAFSMTVMAGYALTSAWKASTPYMST